MFKCLQIMFAKYYEPN